MIMQVKPACEVGLPMLATSRTLNISRIVVPLFAIVTSTSSLFVTTAYLDSVEKRRNVRTGSTGLRALGDLEEQRDRGRTKGKSLVSSG